MTVYIHCFTQNDQNTQNRLDITKLLTYSKRQDKKEKKKERTKEEEWDNKNK